MSTQLPAYRITDALAALDLATLNLEEVRRILSAPVAPEPPPGYVLHPGDDPAVALADLRKDDTLWVADGVHPYAVHLPKRVHLRAVDGGQPAFSGWRSVEWEHLTRNIWKAQYDRFGKSLDHRTTSNASLPSDRRVIHNNAARPDLLMYKGEFMADMPSSSIVSGEFFYDGGYGLVYVAVMPGDEINDARMAQYPQLLTAADGVNGVTIEGITFDGAANTTKQGAVQAYGERWLFDRVTVRNVNSVGFMVGGIGHRFIDCHAYDCGQMGWAGKIDGGVFDGCGHTRSNWKGFDAGWEAGFKLSYSRGNTFTNWTATDCDGPGFWLDISNYDNVLDGFEIVNCMKAGLMLEHYAGGNVYRNGAIRGTRAWPVTGARVGLQIQSHCTANRFENISITDSGTPVVYKAAESRGPSNKNQFHVVAGDAPWRIEGKLSGDDKFTNCTPQPV